MHWIQRRIQGKLFLSHLVTALISILIFFAVSITIAPQFLPPWMHQRMMDKGIEASSSVVLDQLVLDSVRRALRIAGLAGVILAFILSLIIARQLSRPIKAMAWVTDRIGHGHYGERVQVSSFNREDEVGQLATSVNQMADSLERIEARRMELIGDVAHELRTPLTTLQSTLEAMLDGIIAPTPEQLGLLVDETGRLRRLVDDLRELSRTEAGQISLSIAPCSLSSLLEGAANRFYEPMGEKELELQLTLPTEPLQIKADPDRVMQILTNLLSNALRYTPLSGKVFIDTKVVGNMIQIVVKDTGIGLKEEDQERIFDRFYRVEKSRARSLGGSGIGLTIARALAEAMEGDLTASSDGPGKGSCFTLVLPLASKI
jgi:signal transduction histidine kinase